MADRLAIYTTNPAEGEITSSFFAWGSVLRNSTGDKLFLIKNESDEYFARGVTVQAEDGSGSPGLGDQILFSLDGWTYTDVLSVGDLPPFGISSEVKVRRVLPWDAESGSFQILVKAESWISSEQAQVQEVLTDVETG